MTTEQIIKALECCTSETGCTGCPRFPSVMGCCRQNMIDALALIKELQAHNITLKKENKYLRERLAEEAELKEDMVVVRTARSGGKAAQLNKVIHIKKDEIIADTVKRMQELIKERCIEGGIYPAFVARTIDQIAKEILNESQ